MFNRQRTAVNKPIRNSNLLFIYYFIINEKAILFKPCDINPNLIEIDVLTDNGQYPLCKYMFLSSNLILKSFFQC